MDFITLTIEILNVLAKIFGSYGFAIICFTIIMRLILWPVNVSQQRSMKNMQMLQPKMKIIQEKYKNNPQQMQEKMMEFYKEHKFNPASGCLPMLIQLPIFIMLYSALMSPQFINLAGNTHFLFINRLDSTMKSSTGVSFDGKFTASKNPSFKTSNKAKVYIGNEVLDNVKIKRPQKAVETQGEIQDNQQIDLKIALDEFDLTFAQLEKISKVELQVSNAMTREAENVTFERYNSILRATVPITPAKNDFHVDVVILIALFGLTIWLSQKVMLATTNNKNADPQQAAMQKTMGTVMPIMIIMTFVIIPIPAGALLYLITSNIFQIGQTVVINKQLELEDKNKTNAKNQDVIDVKVIDKKENNNNK